MIVSAARNDSKTVLAQTGRERFRIYHNLALVIAELRLKRFMKTDGFCRNDVHERSTLNAGEQHRIDFLGEPPFAENNAAARSAQTFVCRRSDKLCVRNRRRMLAARDQSRDV